MKKLFLSIIALLVMATAVHAKETPLIQLYVGSDSINITDADSIAFTNWYLSFPDNYFMKKTTSFSSFDKSYASEDSLYVYQTEGTRSSVMAFQLSSVDSIARSFLTSFPEDLPVLENPGNGQITIAVLPPKGTTCEGVGMVGSGFVRGAWAPATCMPMERHAEHIYWYTQTVQVSAGAKAEDIQIQLLALLDAQNGYSEWKYQWGKNIPGQIPNVRILQGKGNLGTAKDPILQGMKDNSVVYVEILNWENPPCTPRNEEGQASFTLDAKNLADPNSSLQIGIVGNFDKYSNYQAWDYSHPILMQKEEDGLWKANVEVSPAFEYSYVYSFDGVFVREQAMRGEALEMPLDLKANDTVDTWNNMLSLTCNLDTLGIGYAVEVKLNANADLRNIQWSLKCEPEGVAEIQKVADDKSLVLIEGLAEGRVDVIAFNGYSYASYQLIVSPEAGFVESLPEISAPAPGSVTLVVRVPEGTVDCGGVGVVGAHFVHSSEWNPGDALPMEKVEGTQTWWVVTLEASAGYSVDQILCKVLGLAENKTYTSWANQWGKDDDVTILDGVGSLKLSGTNEPQLSGMEDGGVIYIDIAGWQSAPCQQKNPAGTATFILTAENLPAEATAIQITGNFPFESEYLAWAPGSGLPFVKQADGTWTASCEVPAAFEYKYVWSADGINWDWHYAQARFDNIQMAIDLQANDVIDAWIGGAKLEDPVW